MISKKKLIREFILTFRGTVRMMQGCVDSNIKMGLYNHCYYSTCCMHNIGLITLDKMFYLHNILSHEFYKK